MAGRLHPPHRTFAVTAMVPSFFMAAFLAGFFGEGVVLAGDIPLVWDLVRPSDCPSKMAAASWGECDTLYDIPTPTPPTHRALGYE